MVAEVRHKLLPKQDELIYSTERHTVYSGAVGAGKSRSLCIDALIHCAGRPETRYGLFRKTRAALVKSTIKTLLAGDGFAPPVLPHGSYVHNKQLGEVQLKGGGLIIYSGVESPEAVRSMNLTRAGIDEVTELSFDDYNAVDDRVRVDVGEPLRVLSATNPGTPSHWLARMMGLSPQKQTPDQDCKIILTKTEDNTYLPASYIRSFDRHKGTLYYRRMFLGEWCGSEGLVYDKWDRSSHAVVRHGACKRRIVGVDEGYTDPFAVVVVEVDPDGRAHVAREFYDTQLVQAEKIAAVREAWKGEGEVVVDSAAPDLIESLRRAGIPALACDKGPGSIEFGINLVQSRLAKQGDGLPRLSVDPSCINTVREFETYEWKKGAHGLRDVPLDMNNHALDALRYAVRHLEGSRGPYIADLDEIQAAEKGERVEEEGVLASLERLRSEDPEWGWN